MTRVVAITRAIARANLIRMVRDRTTAFFNIILPFLIIFMVGIAFGAGAIEQIQVGAVAADTPLAQRLVERIEADEALSVDTYDDEEALRDAVRRQDVFGGLVLPEDYDQQAATGTAEVELVTGPTGGVPAAVNSTISSAVNDENARIAAVRAATDADDPEEIAEALTRIEDLEPSATVRTTQPGDPEDALPVGFESTAPQNLVLFVFITSLFGGAALIESRRLGVVRRGLAAPTTSSRLLLGEATSRYVIALLQAVIVVVGSVLLFGVEWRDWPSTIAITVLFSLVGTGAAMLVGATFSSDEQAAAVAPPLGIGLGMLGGCMWPLEIVPEAMQTVGHLTPHAWAMDAFNAVQARGAGIGDITTELAVLAGYGIALLAASSLMLRRSLTT